MKTMLIRMYGLYLNTLAVLAPARAATRGFLLFCRPFRGKLTPKQQHFFNTAEKFTMQLEENVIQGYRWGKGSKIILFLHGWQSHTYRWKAYIEALSKDDYTIYALDAPGHGLSEGNFLTVPLYSSLIENFVTEKGNLHSIIGHSLGGFSLLYTFHRLPLLPVNKIVLMAPPGEADDFVSFFQETLKLSDKTIGLIVSEFERRYDVKPDFFSTKKFAGSINLKGLIIHDEEDPEAPYHYSPSLNKVWSKSRLITTKGLGHNLKSASVVKEVVDFVEEPVHQPAFHNLTRP
jgi:pimeloyl-ACP methyl ester carboxylesterase